jgi:hypothetical protein
MAGQTGQVYLFNTTNLKIIVTLNGNALPSLAPAGGAGESYAPPSMTVPRSDATSIDDPVFAKTNTMSVMFSGSFNNYNSVVIDPVMYSTNKDLLLYIFYDYIVLVDSTTNMIITNQAPS